MNFKPGPVRLRGDEYEAEILCVDMGGDRPILARFRRDNESWSTQRYSSRGRVFDHEISCIDIMPPKLSRDDVVHLVTHTYVLYGRNDSSLREVHKGAMRAALDHYDTLRKEGLCDEGESL